MLGAIAVTVLSLIALSFILTSLYRPHVPWLTRVGAVLSIAWAVLGIAGLAFAFSGYGGAVDNPKLTSFFVLGVYVLPGTVWFVWLRKQF